MGNDYNISNLNLNKNIDLNGYSSNTSKISGENELLFNYNAHKKFQMMRLWDFSAPIMIKP